ncbi:hypothetical protein SERLA73DRAFT_180787 [Serpula lacrymans var. lacrymans S7.3]|uniref:Enoyl reductase (ER) domain-containing protein n=2 Tax=Serpula lacrymans var. lacrymans TaxID=341189 RepID=F8PWG1_SERL3|nr:uncharacterized protein SERLADRAFT_466542 [Serpula lacrymans var. lacrymans S7.9]EGO00285.1 hypothetical protein SERLA73DRAFT_180787 [Serpula lacrymans var. lacrymans S7.3]EGO25844.1 hypothetical protein SERLADRAFT_466542 [Serpula lacrymans var. lacrymans S7.9]
MSSQTSLWLTEERGSFAVGPHAIPTPEAGEILVKVESAGLNPVDWKIQAHAFWVEHYPAILGNEGAGIVEAVGPDVTQFAKGERVLFQATMDNRKASFQQYVIVPAEIVGKIPSNISFDQAATLPVCIATTALSLYSPAPNGIGLRAPWDGGRGSFSGQPALVIGGATSVGQYAIQWAKLSGFSPIITTASLHNTALLKSTGATHVLDRGLSPSALSAEILKITSTPIKLVYDSVTAADAQQAGYDILAPGGHLILALEQSVKVKDGDNKTVFRVFGNIHPPHKRAFAAALFGHLTKYLADGDIIPNTVEVVPGGLNGVASGLQRLKDNLVSGRKLVVHPHETV